jgi:DNA-binding PadR family transcriptional regulator
VSVRLVILGLLKKGPIHGYELKRIVEDEMGDWTHIAVGSIYFALEKLKEEGLIQEVETKQEGNRPSRTIYAITEPGRAEFMNLLRETWANVEHPFHAFDTGIAFMDDLPRDEVIEYLRARIGALEKISEGLAQHKDAELKRPDVPAIAHAIFEHSAAHYQAELAWTKSFLCEMEATPR